MASNIDHLEILSRQPETPCDKPPILFVHGAYAGAWCWDVHFLDFFAEAGFPSYALSFRGHGGSKGHNQLHQLRISDYVNDVKAVVDHIEGDPILVGHSMGGFVLQKFLERFRARAVCLMAAVPPEGIMYSAMQLAFDDPMLYHQMNVMQALGRWTTSPDILRRALFSPEVPEEELLPYFRLFQDESSLAILDMSWLDLPNLSRVHKTDMCVIGAERDAFFSRKRVQATAESFGCAAHIIPRMSHAIMLEPNWKEAAHILLEWVKAVR